MKEQNGDSIARGACICLIVIMILVLCIQIKTEQQFVTITGIQPTSTNDKVPMPAYAVFYKNEQISGHITVIHEPAQSTAGCTMELTVKYLNILGKKIVYLGLQGFEEMIETPALISE